MKKPQVVVLTSRLPYPLDKGDKLRVYNQLKVLNRHFEVHLICLHDQVEAEFDDDLVSSCCSKIYVFELPKKRSKRQVLINIPAGLPLQVAYFYDRHIAKRIDHLLWQLQPDFIHCHLVRMAPYCSNYKGCPKSIDYMDSLVLNDLAGQYLSSGFKKMFKHRERNRIQKYETDIFDQFNYHFTISERDRGCFSSSIKERIGLLHNGVDLSYYELNAVVEPTNDLVFCGNLGYAPNIEAVNFLGEKIMPELPESTLLIAGADGDERLSFGASSNMIMRGRVEDIRSIYQSGKVMIAPIFNGAGQQNKILEAMALGIPCLTTSFVNEGLGAEAGEEILLADDASSFLRLIKDLLSQPEKRKRLSLAGRRFVETKFDWELNTAPLVNTIKKELETYE